jgi:hypothetical protein
VARTEPPTPSASTDARLRALDPVADDPYAHPDVPGMLARIVEAAPGRPRHRVHRPDLAAVGGLLATGLATIAIALAVTPAVAPVAGSLGLSIPATSAAPLSLSWSARDVSHEGPSKITSLKEYGDETKGSVADALFAAGAPLSAASPVQRSYRAAAPGVPARALAALAVALGLRDARVTGHAGAWRAVAPGGAVATLVRDPATGLESLSLQPAPAGCPLVDTSAGLVDADDAAMRASLGSLVVRLGLHFGLGEARIAPSWDAAGLRPCGPRSTVVEQVLLGGTPTDQVASATFSPTGALVAATIPVFTAGTATAFPLVSARAAAATLVRTTSADVYVTPGVFYGTNTRELAGTSTYARGVRTVLLRTATLTLRAFATPSGATWFVPVYSLTGDEYADVAADAPSPWSADVLAAASPAVRLLGATSNQAIILDERAGAG